jgi:hypothetical protein
MFPGLCALQRLPVMRLDWGGYVNGIDPRFQQLADAARCLGMKLLRHFVVKLRGDVKDRNQFSIFRGNNAFRNGSPASNPA